MHRLGVAVLELGRSSRTHRVAHGQNELDAQSVRVTLSMTAAERDALRALAKARGTTVSGLIQQWIDERCDVAPSLGDGRVRLNVRQRMDGLAMLGRLATSVARACSSTLSTVPRAVGQAGLRDEGERRRGRAAWRLVVDSAPL